MTAAVESVSPSMCGKTLRMLTSPENFQSSVAMAHRSSGHRRLQTVHHQARLDGDGVGETVDGGVGDPAGEVDQGECVEEGREDSGALVAKGFFLGGGAGSAGRRRRS